MQSVRNRVLIVDRNEDVLLTLEWMLENAGFDTTTTWSGRDALLLLISRRFDLLLISGCLPDAKWQVVRRAFLNRASRPCCVLMRPLVPLETRDAIGDEMTGCDCICEREFSQIVGLVIERLGHVAMTAQAA
jgi:DNA-binding response OmpR family regulator